MASAIQLVNKGVNTLVDTPESIYTSPAAGNGIIVDAYTDPTSPVVTPVAWAAFDEQTVTNLATQEATDIGIDITGAIVQVSSIQPTHTRMKPSTRTISTSGPLWLWAAGPGYLGGSGLPTGRADRRAQGAGPSPGRLQNPPPRDPAGPRGVHDGDGDQPVRGHPVQRGRRPRDSEPGAGRPVRRVCSRTEPARSGDLRNEAN